MKDENTLDSRLRGNGICVANPKCPRYPDWLRSRYRFATRFAPLMRDLRHTGSRRDARCRRSDQAGTSTKQSLDPNNQGPNEFNAPPRLRSFGCSMGGSGRSSHLEWAPLSGTPKPVARAGRLAERSSEDRSLIAGPQTRPALRRGRVLRTGRVVGGSRLW